MGSSGGAGRPRFAVWPVMGAVIALVAVLVLTAPEYGYHRDELYFRMLDPAWGYTDQPPLTPLLAQAAIAVFGDSVIALRVLSLLFAAASIPVIALIAREAGGGRLAQGLAAFSVAGASITLAFGHVLLTASMDLVVWPLAVLFVMRAVLRDEGRWWLAAGAVVGVSTFNKLLVVSLLGAVALGLAVFGPRTWFRSGWLWAGVALVVLGASPNLLYQLLNGFPQLAMGAALGESNSTEVRVMMWPYLVLMVGPVVTIFWVVGLAELFRNPNLRSIRFLAVALIVMVGFVFVAGSQFYYSYGVLVVLVAVGSVAVARWANSRGRRALLITGLAVNAAGCALTALPLLPVQVFGASGLAAVNWASADQVGWQRYAEQVEAVARASGAEVIIASNYGEAGALDRFGTGAIPVVSGHNALWAVAAPPAEARTVVIVGGQSVGAAGFFDSCELQDRLDNGVRVANGEQELPITVCTGPREPWSTLWPQFAHLG